MKQIPTALMEEHRDAYYHWHRMIDMGSIPAAGNYLLHVDHHDDMDCTGYGWDLTRMPGNAVEALEFTDRCLGIGDFIVPAMWEQIFSTVHILKELVPTRITTERRLIALMEGSREFLTVEEDNPLAGRRNAQRGAPWLHNEGSERKEVACVMITGATRIRCMMGVPRSVMMWERRISWSTSLYRHRCLPGISCCITGMLNEKPQKTASSEAFFT